MKLNVCPGLDISKSEHVYKQIFGTIAAALLSVSGGIVLGYTAVLLPQLKSDKKFPYDEFYDSWIAAIAPLAMTIGCIFAGGLSDAIGRKRGQILLTIPYVFGWVVMALANNYLMLLIGRFVTGLCAGSTRSFAFVYIGEIFNPKHRSTGLLIPTLAVQIGFLLSHILGKYVYWKICCFLFIIPNILNVLILLFLYESPLWLLVKGKIDEGKESFISYRGRTEISDKELTLVLNTCNKRVKSSFKTHLDLILSKPFLKNLCTIFVMFIAMQWSGINSLTFYAQDIFDKTFSGEVDGFILMIATDCIRLMSCLIICLLGKIIPRKTTLVVCCFTSSVALVALSISLYLRPTGLIWVGVTFLIIYVAVTSVLIGISWTFSVEIFPSQIRGFSSGLCSALSNILLFISVKVTPDILSKYGEIAMYGSFAVVMLVTGTILHFLIPNTTGRSLQDIENEMFKREEVVNKKSEMIYL